MKVKFNTATVFASPSLSIAGNEIVDLDEHLVKPYIEAGIATVVEEEVVEEKPKRTTKKKAKEDVE